MKLLEKTLRPLPLKKVKVWDSPYSKLEVPSNGARKILDGIEDHTPCWEPQEEGMMQSSGNFPRLRNPPIKEPGLSIQ